MEARQDQLGEIDVVTRTRQPVSVLQHAVDPAGWRTAEISRSTEWIHPLSREAIAELDAAVAQIEARKLKIMDIHHDSVALPVLGRTLANIRNNLLEGRGVALLRGLPVDRYSVAQSAIAFWCISCQLGVPVSQNAKGHLVGHIKDLGHSQANANQRAPQSRESIAFHADDCDIVGLMCLQPAKSGGASSIVSSVTLHNEMLRRRPDLAEELAKTYCIDRRGEVPEGKKPWFELPLFSYEGGYLSVYAPGRNLPLAQRHSDVPRLTARQWEALAMFNQLAEELKFDMAFERGDVQFLHNHVVLHSRTAYEDHLEPGHKRHLLRVWLATSDGRPLAPEFYDRFDCTSEHGRPFGITTRDTVLHAPLEAS